MIRSIDSLAYVIICILFVLLIGYSPFLFLVLCLLFLCFGSFFFNNKFLRLIFIALVSFYFIIVFASRNYFDELDSDLSIYYHFFSLLQIKLEYGLNVFGGGAEVGWPLLYWFVGIFFDLKPIHLAIINTLFSISLVLFWFERKIVPYINEKEKGILYFFVFLFSNFLMLGFLQRQSLTLGILLFALTSKNNRNLIFFIIIASLFHLSSILVGLLIFLARNITFTKKNIFYIISIIIVARFFIVPLLTFLISFIGLGFFTHKANTFISGDFSISTLRYFVLYLCLFPVLLHPQYFNRVEDKYLYNYAVLTTICIVAFVGIPLFADRIFMIGLLVYGLFYYKFFFTKYKRLSICFALLYLIVFMLEKLNLIGSLELGDTFWSRYNFWDVSFLYYLERL